jgi:hypothetical protein
MTSCIRTIILSFMSNNRRRTLSKGENRVTEKKPVLSRTEGESKIFDIVGTVCHLVIYMQSNKIHKVCVSC